MSPQAGGRSLKPPCSRRLITAMRSQRPMPSFRSIPRRSCWPNSSAIPKQRRHLWRCSHVKLCTCVRASNNATFTLPVIASCTISRSTPVRTGALSWCPALSRTSQPNSDVRTRRCTGRLRIWRLPAKSSASKVKSGSQSYAYNYRSFASVSRIVRRLHPIALLEAEDPHPRIGKAPRHRGARCSGTDDQDIDFIMHETPAVLACPDGVAVVESYPLPGDPVHMTLILIIVAAIAVIWFVERSVEHLELAVAALCFSAAVLLFVVTA